MNRLGKLKKNIVYGYVATILTMLLAFVSRTVFLTVLNETYLGVYSLYANILGVLSFADLGLGIAMNFALYKPVAENDIEKIKSLMNYYKKSYHKIAIIILIIGLAILPFLEIIVKNPGDIGNIYIYYLIYLFNTISSYFVSYKYSLINAEQKGYIVTKINMIVEITTLIINIIVLIIFRNFIIYLISSSVILILKTIFVSKYLDKLYPFLKEKSINQLDNNDLAPIKRNVNALIFHKFGEIAIYQTDNIIVSSFINVTTVGKIANYNIIITSINSLVNILFSSATAAFGNLVTEGNLEKNLHNFKIYNFINFWIYGFCSISFYILLSPFITLWLGETSIIDNYSILLMCISNYFLGQRIAYLNFKTAFGQFYDDKYVVLISAIINLVISVIMVNIIGLPGIYVGTLVSGLFESIVRPLISYKKITRDKTINYFYDLIKYSSICFTTLYIIQMINKIILKNINIINFIGMMIVIVIVVNFIFWITTKNSNIYKETKKYILKAIKR